MVDERLDAFPEVLLHILPLDHIPYTEDREQGDTQHESRKQKGKQIARVHGVGLGCAKVGSGSGLWK